MADVEQSDISAMADAVRQIGDSWTLLIIWAALHGVTRFDTFQRRLGVARNILSNRLARLVDEGILEKRPVHAGARRLEYRITPKGMALRPVLEWIEDWGAKNRRSHPHRR
ncbi:helix-turn-helix transcriptional regulator [Limibaculum sp. M0105]|uniref:Helix-turn-helix transcriptional regulator n=1 Tax=Thermohalobaculum xanthum TaxID=2753746 RepID=A0A8J7SHH1_9RHOB|nr:helix-turn-helix domain-containing protein [Thermohalobaculum xanthum]MBK0399695.1 helix-turn-helix transcriptional regulator [Thermohalobaculum xanthum]